MTQRSIPEALDQARSEIDEIDRELIGLLARRFAVTYQVGVVKAQNALDSVDPQREELKLARVREICKESGVNPDLGTELFILIMAEAVRNHDAIKVNS